MVVNAYFKNDDVWSYAVSLFSSSSSSASFLLFNFLFLFAFQNVAAFARFKNRVKCRAMSMKIRQELLSTGSDRNCIAYVCFRLRVFRAFELKNKTTAPKKKSIAALAFLVVLQLLRGDS